MTEINSFPDVEIANSPQTIAQAKELEYEVFADSGFITRNDQHEVLEYSSYNGFSDFFIVQEESKVVGELRRIRFNPELGFKTLSDFGPLNTELEQRIQKVLWKDPSQVEEIGTVSVVKEKRSARRLISTALYRASWQEARKRGVVLWIASMDQRLFGTLNDVFQFGFEQIAEPKDYMGSITIPGVLDIERLHNDWLKGENPFWGNLFLTGY